MSLYGFHKIIEGLPRKEKLRLCIKAMQMNPFFKRRDLQKKWSDEIAEIEKSERDAVNLSMKKGTWPFDGSMDFESLFDYVKGIKIRNKMWNKDDYIIPESKKSSCSCGRLTKGVVAIDEKGKTTDLWNLKNPAHWEYFET